MVHDAGNKQYNIFQTPFTGSNLLKKVFSLNWPTNAITTRTFLWLKLQKSGEDRLEAITKLDYKTRKWLK